MRRIASASIDYGLAGAGGAVADARRRCSPVASASTRSTRCSRTCSSCTATRRRTAIAGLVAAIVAGAQILGGLAAPRIRRLFRRRTSALLATGALSVLTLALIGTVESFWTVLGLIVVWGLLFAASMPIRQTYLNALIPSRSARRSSRSTP